MEMLNNPILIVLGALAVLLNLVFSGGTLYKLIDFARDYGALKEKVHTHAEEIERLRAFTHDLRDGKIPFPTKH